MSLDRGYNASGDTTKRNIVALGNPYKISGKLLGSL